LDRSYPLKRDPESPECHFVLRVDKIVMHRKWKNCLFKGKGFPRLPIDFGFRNNAYFWFTRGARPYKMPIPKEKGVTVNAVQFAVQRYDPDIQWQEEACAKLVKAPRVFLTRAIAACVEAAREEGVTEITPEFVEQVRDRRRGERGRRNSS
jgi:hypothetical protein